MLNILFGICIGSFAAFIVYLAKITSKYYNVKNDKDIYIHYPQNYWSWYKETKNLPIFTFKEFINFYTLDPESWFYEDEDHQLAKLPACRIGIHKNFCNNEYDYQPIFFTNMFEYKKYLDWATNKVNKNNQERIQKIKDKQLAIIINKVTNDINANEGVK